jgi:polysaccharide biosynthesis/export protein
VSLLGEEAAPQRVSGFETEARTEPGAKTIARPGAPDYIISPDDLLDVNVFDVPEFSRLYRVSPSGSITLPLVRAPIAAAGLTTAQLSNAIRDRLQADGLVSKAQVTMEVKESRLHSVAVTGAVKKPQIYPVFAQTTLLDVLSQAEGLSEDAGKVATITRGDLALAAQGLPGGQDGGQSPVAQTITVDLKRLLQTGDPRLNVALYPGDRVTVQRAGVIYVVGAVGRPGGFTLKNDQEQMTVLKAIALAEDLKSTAIRNRAMIIRDDPASAGKGRKELPVNLSEVLKGRVPDPPLEANDILFVPDSSAKKAMRRAAEVAVQIATGVIVWR